MDLHLPDGFSKGVAAGGGDCFFDSFAKGMRNLGFPNKEFTIKSLRMECFKYAEDNEDSIITQGQKQCTLRKQISDDALEGGYAVKGEQERSNFDSYLVRIKLTAEDGEQLQCTNMSGAIWGRPEIEGRMLCNVYGVKLHIVEMRKDGLVGHCIVDGNGAIDKGSEFKDWEDKETKMIHIFNKEGTSHFEPIVKYQVSHKKCYNLEGAQVAGKEESDAQGDKFVPKKVCKTEKDQIAQKNDNDVKDTSSILVKRKVSSSPKGEYINEPKQQKMSLSQIEIQPLNADDGSQSNLRKRYNSGKNASVSNPAKKPNIFSDALETYATSSTSKNTQAGVIYQLKLHMIFLKRALNEGYNFGLATEVAAAEKFDDLTFEYQNPVGNGTLHRFLQAKHRCDDSKTVSAQQLLMDNDDDFSLAKYFKSYCKIKTSHVFRGELKDFILCTNIGLDLKGLKAEGIVAQEIEEIEVPDKFLKMEVARKKATRYKFPGEQHKLFKILKETSGLHTLGKTLAAYINDNKKLTLRLDIFKDHHKALLQEYIFVKKTKTTGKFHEKFITNDPGLSEEAKVLRTILQKSLKKGKTVSSTTTFELSIPFCNRTEEDEKMNAEYTLPNFVVSDHDISEFLEKFVFVNTPNEVELGEIIEHELGKDSLFNLLNSKLVGDSFQTKMLDWFKAKLSVIIKKNNGQAFLDSVQQEISILICVGLKEFSIKDLKKYDLQFRSEAKKLDEFLTKEGSGAQILNLVTSEDSLLTSCMVYQKLTALPSFKPHDSYIFISLSALLDSTIQTYVTKAFASGKSFNLLVIECTSLYSETDTSVRTLCRRLSQVMKSDSKKKVICITPTVLNDFVGRKLKSDPDFEKRYLEKRSTMTFKDLTKETQDKLLRKKIMFQGVEKIFEEIIDENSTDVIDMAALVKLVKEDDINVGVQPMCLSDLEAANIRPYNEEISVHILVETLLEKPEESSLFLIGGIDQSDSGKMEVDLLQKLRIAEDDENAIKLRKALNIKRILTAAQVKEEDFKKICHENGSQKQIYWIKWENDQFSLKQTFNPNFYIERHFEYRAKTVLIRTQLVEKLLIQRNHRNFFVFMCTTMTNLLNLIVISEKQEVFSQNIALEDNVEHIQEAQKQDKHIHWIMVEDNEFVWNRSDGSLDDMCQCIDDSKSTYLVSNEEEFYEEFKNKSVIILDNPGMGKSTTLSKLAQRAIKSNWVIYINLKDCKPAVTRLSYNCGVDPTDDIVEFLLEAGSVRSNGDLAITKGLLKYRLMHTSDKYPLLLLFDGFDEIKDENGTEELKVMVSFLLKFLKDNATVWVTARKQEARRLRNSLSVFETNFVELKPLQKMKFLKTFWKDRFRFAYSKDLFDDKVVIYSDKLLTKASTVFGRTSSVDFMGVPLQMRLMAEYFHEDFEMFLKSENTDPEISMVDNVLNLYHYFINERYNIYFKPKTDLSTGFSKVSKGWFKDVLRKQHWRLALKETFGDKGNDFLKTFFEHEVNTLTNDHEELDELLRVGLVKSATSSVSFIHHTFAEYFVADAFFDRLNKTVANSANFASVRKFLSMHIFKESSKVVYYFLERRIMKIEERSLKYKWGLIEECDLSQHVNCNNKLEYVHGISMYDKLYKYIENKMKWSPSSCDLQDKYMLEDMHQTFMKDYESGSLGDYIAYCYDKWVLSTPMGFKFKRNRLYHKVVDYIDESIKQRKFDNELLNSFLTDPVNKRQAQDVDTTLCHLATSERFKNVKLNQLKEYICSTADELELHRIKLKIAGQKKDLTKSAISEIYEKKDLEWLGTEGIGILKETVVLTNRIADAFVADLMAKGLDCDSTSFDHYSSYARIILYQGIWPVVDSMKYRELINIDKSALLKMFHCIVEFNSNHDCSFSLSTHRLKIVLNCIENILDETLICGKNLSIVVRTLLCLGAWNLKLINAGEELLIQDPAGDFQQVLKLNHKDQIVQLVRWKQKNPDDDLKAKCHSVAVDMLCAVHKKEARLAEALRIVERTKSRRYSN